MPTAQALSQPTPPGLRLSAQEVSDIKQKLLGATPAWFERLSQLLLSADYQLAQLMYQQSPPIWSPTTPPQQPPNYDANAPIELGPVLYSLENPLPSSILAEIPAEWRWLVSAVWWIVGEVFETNNVTTQIQPTDFKQLCVVVETKGIIADDGTCYGLRPYEGLDDKWSFAVANFAVYWLKDDLLAYLPTWVGDIWPWTPAAFNTNPAGVIQLPGTKPQIKIALVGDWGTGESVAGNILTQIQATNPDYIIHLGDVYYAGTSDLDILDAGEETNHLVKMFRAASVPGGTSFTLNSNHEMYGGARGYYNVALQDPLFQQQQSCSYFALQYAGWTILGLDSAYYADLKGLFMNGSIQDPGSAQINWIKSIVKPPVSPQNTIVLTHHNGLQIADDGSITQNNLWTQMKDALGGNPAYWYWGHVHNGIVYTPQASVTNTQARCVGHGALPFGNASEFVSVPKTSVPYYAHTPVSPTSNLVLNGFAVLTINQDGTVQENFYELGNPKPVWSTGPSLA